MRLRVSCSRALAFAAAIAGVLSAAALAPPLVARGFPSGHDTAAHLTYVYLFDAALSQGQFPVRWIEWIRPGHSQPLFNFYQPGLYYTVQLVHALVPSLLLSTKLTIVGAWWCGAAFLYLYLRPLGSWPALLGSLVFMRAPYLILDVFVRAAFPEFLALALAPIVLWSLDRTLRSTGEGYPLALAAASAAMLLCHLPTVLMFLPVFVTYAGGVWLFGEAAARSVPRAAGAAALGFALGCFYVAPALLELPFTKMRALTSAYFDYRTHFVEPWQWFSQAWGYGGSEPGVADRMSFQLGLVQWLALATAIGAGTLVTAAGLKSRPPTAAGLKSRPPTAAGLKSRPPVVPSVRGIQEGGQEFTPAARVGNQKGGRDFSPAAGEQSARWLVYWLCVAAAALLMTSAASAAIWRSMPPLAFVQFPWRFLTVASLATGIVAALTLSLLRSRTAQAVIVLCVAGGLWWQTHDLLRPSHYLPRQWVDIDNPAWRYSRDAAKLAFIEPGYFPATVTRLPEDYYVPRWRILHGAGVVSPRELLDDRLVLDVRSDRGMELTVTSHGFPGWRVLIDGNDTAWRYDRDYGFIVVDVPRGAHVVEAVFGSTPVRKWANGISIVAVVVWAGLAAGFAGPRISRRRSAIFPAYRLPN